MRILYILTIFTIFSVTMLAQGNNYSESIELSSNFTETQIGYSTHI